MSKENEEFKAKDRPQRLIQWPPHVNNKSMLDSAVFLKEPAAGIGSGLIAPAESVPSSEKGVWSIEVAKIEGRAFGVQNKAINPKIAGKFPN